MQAEMKTIDAQTDTEEKSKINQLNRKQRVDGTITLTTNELKSSINILCEHCSVLSGNINKVCEHCSVG